MREILELEYLYLVLRALKMSTLSGSIKCLDSTISYGFGLSNFLPNAAMKFDKNKSLETIPSTADIAETGYALEGLLYYTHNAKEVSLKFSVSV